MIPDVSTNYLAVLVAAIVSMILGMFWFSPAVFGRSWMKLSKINEKDIEKAKQKGMWKSYLIAFIATIVMAYVLAYLIELIGISTIKDGLWAGFFLWIGFVATTMIGMVLWEGKSWKLYFINVGFQLVSLLLMSVILAVWP